MLLFSDHSSRITDEPPTLESKQVPDTQVDLFADAAVAVVTRATAPSIHSEVDGTRVVMGTGVSDVLELTTEDELYRLKREIATLREENRMLRAGAVVHTDIPTVTGLGDAQVAAQLHEVEHGE